MVNFRKISLLQGLIIQGKLKVMLHRHLNPRGLSLPALDDIISRGDLEDWKALRREVMRDKSLLKKIHQLCENQIKDPYAQRYYFWKHYSEYRLARLGKGLKLGGSSAENSA